MIEEIEAHLIEVTDVARRAKLELDHWRTVIVPELTAERDRYRAALVKTVRKSVEDSRCDLWELLEVVTEVVTDEELLAGVIDSDDRDRLRDELERWRSTLIEEKQ